VNETQNLIPYEIRPVIKHAKHLSRRGCKDASERFTNFSYIQLNNSQLLPEDLTVDDFSSCEYLSQLQQLLYSTEELDETVTYETFVIIPDDLVATLEEQFGADAEFDGKFVS
jgi:transcriptional regulator NrdR family protein